MSVTLMRNKNGKQVPITLSIWDAFKGAPLPKPRVHKCNSCGKLHKPVCKSKDESAKDESAKDDKEAKKGDSKPGSVKSKDSEKKNDSGFTAEEDAKIKEMKAEDPSCSWVKIAEALDNRHHKDACKHRYKELQSAEKEGDGNEAKGGERSKENKGKDNKNGKKNGLDDIPADRPLSKKEKRRLAKEVEEVEKSAHAQTQETGAAVPEAKAVEEVAPHLASADDRQKWVTAAARHFDRTGQRITAEQARKMAEEST